MEEGTEFNYANHSLEAFGRHLQAVKAKATARKYKKVASQFLDWMLSEKGITAIREAPRHILLDYCDWLVRKGYQPATVELYLIGTQRYLNWLRAQGIQLPDFQSAELPKIRTKVKDILTADIFSHYFRIANELNEPTRSVIMLLPCTGLRGEEIVSLPLKGSVRKVPVKLETGEIKNTFAIVVTGKGGDERLVPVLDEGAHILTTYLREWRINNPDSMWLFPGRNGGHLSSRMLRLAMKHVRQPLKMNFTPHTMRRTYFTSLYRKGVPMATLAKIAGHRSINTLKDHYLALDEQDLAGAVHNAGGSLIEE